tara:strand:- start:1556 stop:1846 length:291 start_codon:yes stop_codon:yes gene_type:complete
MEKIKDLKIIKDVLTNNYHGMKFSDDDMYQVGNRLFINQDGMITVYAYPVNEYFEALDSAINPSTVPFKQYIDVMIKNFYPDYKYAQLNLEGIAIQ